MHDHSLCAAREYALSARDAAAKREYWSSLALRETPGIGMRRISALLARFGSASEAVANAAAWGKAGVPESCIRAFAADAWRQKAGLEWVAARGASCGILLWTDAAYPAWLRTIPDAPPFLYFFGDLSLLANVCVAVVGTRACSQEGVAAARQMAGELSRSGVTVVSGMAKGIDRAAHLAALEGPGRSIGVLGAGIDCIYPRLNGDLYARMRAEGVLLAEYPPSSGIDARNFPIRNRIISGLSRAVVVVEAALRSGSLNTANHALEQNRELMAVPGPASSASAKGCQELVRRGAKPVFCADDVLRELVPLLAEHVRSGLREREEDRFRYPRRGSLATPGDAAPAPAAVHGIVSRHLAPPEAPHPAGEHPAPQTVAHEKPQPENATTPQNGVLHGTLPSFPEQQTDFSSPLSGLSVLESAIYELIRTEPRHIDDICRALGQNAEVVSRLAAVLEVRGVLRRLPGMRYIAGNSSHP